MPSRQIPCTSCDEKGEHWHWEDKPFLSRSFRGPCDSCGGKRFWMQFYSSDLRPLLAKWSLARLLRLGAELNWNEPWIKSLTLRWIRISLKQAVDDELRYRFKMSEWIAFSWFRRIHFAGTPVKPWMRGPKGRLV